MHPRILTPLFGALALGLAISANAALNEWTDGIRLVEIGANGVIYVASYQGKVFKSIDHGNTWTNCGAPWAQGDFIVTLASDPANYSSASRWQPLRLAGDRVVRAAREQEVEGAARASCGGVPLHMTTPKGSCEPSCRRSRL